MSKNINQVYIANPITVNASTDLMYFGQSPYGAGNDAAMTYANFSAQFGAPYTPAALTEVNDTNVTLTLGGTPNTALLHAVSLTLGWTGTLSGTRGGTGVNNGANTATFAGNLNFANAFTTSGNFAVTQTYTNTTNVTFPTSGTLATTSQLPTPAALTSANDTNVTLTLGGTPATALLQAASVTAGWTGTLAVGRGGLGIGTTPTNGQLPIGNGTNYVASTLTQGTGISITNGAGTITVASTGAVPTSFVTDSGTATPSANSLTISGSSTGLTTTGSGSTVGLTGTLVVGNGGTGRASLTTYTLLAGGTTATGNLQQVAAGSTGQVLQSQGASALPAYSTATYPSTGGTTGTILRSNGTNWVNSTSTFADTYSASTLLYSNGANTVTGLATANSASLVTNSTGVPAWSSTMTNGQLIIGSTGATPTAGTLTAGTGISIANAAASITISTSGADLWVDQTTSSVTMSANHGYTSDAGASLITFTLPTSSAIGDWVEINGKGSGGWTVAQASGQQIHIGNATTTLGATGTLSSTNQYDCIRLRCLTANTIWTVASQQSSGLTVV